MVLPVEVIHGEERQNFEQENSRPHLRSQGIPVSGSRNPRRPNSADHSWPGDVRVCQSLLLAKPVI